MTITISPNLEAEVREKAAAEGVPVDAYIERIIEQDLAEDLPDIRNAVMEGLEQIERGEGRDARTVFAELRAKYALPG